MHPAPSLIVFTVLSGLGFGHLAFLGMGLVPVTGWAAFWQFALGYGLVLVGLSASALHLGHPERALKAFSQWRTSWLSREAWLAASSASPMPSPGARRPDTAQSPRIPRLRLWKVWRRQGWRRLRHS
jgi:sulfite dehydrogenase (quinone) subunit SoeC